MRPLHVLLLATSFCAATARAADEDARAIVEKAVKAHGGEEKLTKYKAGTARGKGKVETPGGTLEFTQETSSMLPDKLKEVVELDVAGTPVKIVTLINGDKMSLEVNGKGVELTDELKTALEDGRKRLQMGRLVPLLRDKKFKLSLVGEAKVLDRPAVGVHVEAKGMKDVNLYFDKKTHLLVKVEGRILDPMSKEEMTEERIIVEYKTTDGLPLPKKVLINRDGKKYLEMEIEEARLMEKIDETEFKK